MLVSSCKSNTEVSNSWTSLQSS